MMALGGSNTHHSICDHELRAGDETIGLIGVARDSSYTSVQRQAFAIFGDQVASSLQIARLRRRRAPGAAVRAVLVRAL